MQVPRLVAVAVLGVLLQQLSQPPHAGHPQDVDVVVAAESLQQREVDLQRDVIFILLISGEDAQDHAVRVSAGLGKEQTWVNISITTYSGVTGQSCEQCGKQSFYLHIHEFCGLVDSHRETVLPLSCDQQLLQSLTHRLHPAETRRRLEMTPKPAEWAHRNCTK